MIRSAEYRQQLTGDRIKQVLSGGGQQTSAEIAFSLGVSRQDVEAQLPYLIAAKAVDRHHIQDGTLRYSLALSAMPPMRLRRDGESINDTILRCLGDATRPLLVGQIHDRSGVDRATLYNRLPLLINDGRVVRGGSRLNFTFRLATAEERTRFRASMVSVDVHLDVVLDEINAIYTHPDAPARMSALFQIRAAINQHLENAEMAALREQRSASPC